MPPGWQAATDWRKIREALPAGVFRQAIQARAIDEILLRARSLVRHARRPLRREELGWPEEGELDLDRTLEHPTDRRPEDLRVTRDVPREVEVVAILDMSLSMTGEKIALVALATAILRIKLEHVAVVAFDTVAHPLVRVGEPATPREVVRRVLEVPAQGYTNIEAGLSRGLTELRRSRRRERVGVLFTDGVANVGGDPVPMAARFPRLHVVHLGAHHPQGARCCQQMASAAQGKLFRARTYGDLPGVVRDAVRELFRV